MGRAAIAATAQGFYAALPDMQVYFDDLVIDGHAGRVPLDLHRHQHWAWRHRKRRWVVGYEDWTLDDNGLIAASSGHYDAHGICGQLAHGV